MKRSRQGALVATGAIAGISIILSMAVAWGPHRCALQFPKIIGCALGTYENLSGGLIAAAGALFAGWLAWSAVRDQLKLEKQKILEAKLDEFQLRATGEWRIPIKRARPMPMASHRLRPRKMKVCVLMPSPVRARPLLALSR